MTPRHFRARAGVGLSEQAKRLGVDARDLLVLERTPTELWELRDLARYLAALGLTLAVAAIDPSGVRFDVV